jgi:4-hydroxybenzoate polyprenyltransferase
MATRQSAPPSITSGTLRAAVSALRPEEWIKNLLVFAPLLFSGQVDDSGDLADSTVTFAAFCAMASAGYLVNDVHDAELDRRHPRKRTRPVARGELGATLALVMSTGLALLALALTLALVGPDVAGIVLGYGVVTLAYTFGLKQLVIVDVMLIAGCFLLRVLAGAVAVDATASEWLVFCTGTLALFLGFTKRRQEAASELHSGSTTRPVLEHYSLPFLDQMVAVASTSTVVSYAIYAVDSPLIGSEMLFTAPPVFYGIFRYLYLIYDRTDDRSTATLVARDLGMIAAMLVWGLTALALLYV